MKTIWKFTLQVQDDINIQMPEGATILDCQEQLNDVVLWAMVDSSAPLQIRRFRFFGTGQIIALNNPEMSFVATVQLRNVHLVFHLFELI